MVSNKQALVNEIESLPSDLVDEIFNYVLSIKQLKLKPVSDISLASEQTLAKDWLLPEEDAAWGHL